MQHHNPFDDLPNDGDDDASHTEEGEEWVPLTLPGPPAWWPVHRTAPVNSTAGWTLVKSRPRLRRQRLERTKARRIAEHVKACEAQFNGDDRWQYRHARLQDVANVAADNAELADIPMASVGSGKSYELKTNMHDEAEVRRLVTDGTTLIDCLVNIMWSYAREHYIHHHDHDAATQSNSGQQQRFISERDFLRLLAFEQANDLEHNLCQFINDGHMPRIRNEDVGADGHCPTGYRGYFANYDMAWRRVGEDSEAKATAEMMAVEAHYKVDSLAEDWGLMLRCSCMNMAHAEQLQYIQDKRRCVLESAEYRRAKPLAHYPQVKVYYLTFGNEDWDVYGWVEGDDHFLCNLYP